MNSDQKASGSGDNPLASGRFHEKEQLQNLNERFSHYIQSMRLRREQQMNKQTNLSDERKWTDQIEQQKSFYEQELSDLQRRLEMTHMEKNELEAAHAKFQTMTSEYEERFLSLNETVLKQTDEITKLQVSISTKESELQQAKSQLTAPRTELDICKLERDDLKKRYAEMERRFQMEEKAKSDFQKQLTDLHSRCSREIGMYQQEVNDLHDRLERSRQMIMDFEENSRRSGQRDGEIAEMLRKARESSEMELRRYMEEAEAKHSLNISEIKMRMEADTANLTSLVEENGQLQAETNNVRTELQMAQSQLMSIESAYKVAQSSLDTERKGFEAQMRKMERKLQETQDLLMIKIRELGEAQEANVPLKAEIDMLRNLIEEEEKRLGLDGGFYSTLKSTTNSTNLAMGSNLYEQSHASKTEKNNKEIVNGDSSSVPQVSGGTLPQTNSLFSSVSQPKRPASVPLATNGFMRAPQGSNSVGLFQSSLVNSSTSKHMASSRNSLGGKRAKTSSSSSSTTDYRASEDETGDEDDVLAINGLLGNDKRNSSSNRSISSPGLSHLPPRPDNPTPPKMLPRRPASASGSRYVSADAGQGRDYFDAMFNDLRKDTMYTKVSEHEVGTDTTRVSSTHHDLLNSTASHDVKASKNGNLWYSGSSASATGNLKVIDIDESGKFVRVHNASSSRGEDIGGCLLQQNVAGHPVAVFRFPPRTKLQPGHTATVWSAHCREGIHDPPTHYIWKQLDKWGTGPECTTILCKANGQAVAWMTSAPRVSRVSRAYQYHPDGKIQAAEVARLMNELHVQRNTYEQMQHRNQSAADSNAEDGYGNVASMPYPNSYYGGTTLYSDAPAKPQAIPTLKREKMPQSAPRILPTRTGSAPLRKYISPPAPMQHNSSPLAYQQRLATNGDGEMIELTTQKSTRSKYGFDFMTHPPKVTNYDGTVRER